MIEDVVFEIKWYFRLWIVQPYHNIVYLFQNIWKWKGMLWSDEVSKKSGGQEWKLNPH